MWLVVNEGPPRPPDNTMPIHDIVWIVLQWVHGQGCPLSTMFVGQSVAAISWGGPDMLGLLCPIELPGWTSAGGCWRPWFDLKHEVSRQSKVIGSELCDFPKRTDGYKSVMFRIFFNHHSTSQKHASVAEWLRAWDTLTMFEATVCGRSWVRSPTEAI